MTSESLATTWRTLPGVAQVVFAEDQLDVIDKLKSFVSLYTVILSIVLLLAAILLIWNTIRTAMFARRREIEVMKLVGATDWFIRVPFMLEGLIQGIRRRAGRVLAGWGHQQPLDRRRRRLPHRQRVHGDDVSSSFMYERMLWLVIIGVLAGAIGSGIAASRFLDV